MNPIQPYDFVTAVDSEAIGMVLATAAKVFDESREGQPRDVLVAWISGDCSWEPPENLTKLDSLADMTAKGMIAMWEHGSESASNAITQHFKAKMTE